MRGVGIAIVAVVTALAMPVWGKSGEDGPPVTENMSARKVLDGVILGIARQGEDTVGMVFDGLTALWAEDSTQRDALLVALLDYQVGGPHGGLLAEMITARGKAILPLLTARLQAEPKCEDEFLDGCRPRAERDPLIEEIAAAIDLGEVLCVDVEKCLVRSARSMVSPPFRGILDATLKGDRPITDMAEEIRTLGLAHDRQGLADLLDYQLGPAADALVDEQVTRLGAGMIGELDHAYTAPLVCHPAYTGVCAVDEAARRQRIERLLAAVKSGEVICAEGTGCTEE